MQKRSGGPAAKWIALGLSILISGVGPQEGWGQTNFASNGSRAIEVIPPPMAVFPVSEALRYRVNWWGAEIGTGQIRLVEVADGAAAYRIEAKAKGNDYLSGFFPVEDVFGSEVSPEGHSLLFERDVKEGRYRAHESTRLDYGAGRAVRVSKTDGSVAEARIDGPVHDVLTVFYWARRQPIQVGESKTTTIYLKEKIWELTLKAREIKRFGLPGEEAQDVVVLEPEVRLNGRRVNRGRARIYATADERRIPLLIRLDTPYGPVTATLERSA